ncbi:RNA-directed DNA polymerase, eukaryota, reverse transcriptase zinc-binding domain protein [Tanacetum coccineum]
MWLFLIIAGIDGGGGHFEDGIFTVKELSRMIEETSLHVNDDGQEMLWNKLVPKKVNIFVWRALKGRLPVCLELDKRDINLDSVLCPSCNNATESIGGFFASFGNVNTPTKLTKVWQAVIWTTDYFIWKERNDHVLKNLLCVCSGFGLYCCKSVGQFYVWLQSIDIFWRTLDVSWSKPLEHEDIQCEDELHIFNENFNKQSKAGKRSFLRKLGCISNPSALLVKEPAVKKNTCGRPSLKKQQKYVSRSSAKHGSHTVTRVSERFLKQLRQIFHPYVTELQDVIVDGNCGFQSVAVALGFSQDQWPRIRSDLVSELDCNRQKYKYIFGTTGYKKFYETVKKLENG